MCWLGFTGGGWCNPPSPLDPLPQPTVEKINMLNIELEPMVEKIRYVNDVMLNLELQPLKRLNKLMISNIELQPLKRLDKYVLQ